MSSELAMCPCLETILEKAKEIAKTRLLAHFQERRYRTRPHRAELIGQDGRVICQI